ncbi:hypothetical protein BKA70DRAFT_1471394 [Coprinopsis sp. MPI-PUGE-AT-0042]|nr:hypothetical protein BKA70DRAFT_1471394 [Coprinopsis sp. MPI-PUGE-AT-0042]
MSHAHNMVPGHLNHHIFGPTGWAWEVQQVGCVWHNPAINGYLDFEKPSFETLVERDYSFADPISRITKVLLYQFLAQSQTVYNKVVFPRIPFAKKPGREGLAVSVSSDQFLLSALSGVVCDVRATIWTQILRFAMDLDEINEITGVPLSAQRRTLQGLDERRRTQAFRANLTLVSKEFNAIATPLLYETPTISKSRVLESLAQSQRKGLIKIIYLELFPDPSECLPLHAHQHYQSSTALLVLLRRPYSISICRLASGCRGGDFDAIVMREFAALGQLQRLKSLVLALAIQGPVPRSMITGPTLRLDEGCLPQLQCLGIEGVGSALFENVLECLSTVRFPSLKRFDVEGTHSASCVHTFLKAHGHKLVVLKAALSIRALFSSACPNVSQWIIDDDGGRSSRSFRVGYDLSCLTSVPEGAESALQTITIIGNYHEWVNRLLYRL